MTKRIEQTPNTYEGPIYVPIHNKWNRSWEQKGQIQKIKIPKRIQSKREWNQKQKEKRQKEINARPIDYKLIQMGLPPLDSYIDKNIEKEEQIVIQEALDFIKEREYYYKCNQSLNKDPLESFTIKKKESKDNNRNPTTHVEGKHRLKHKVHTKTFKPQRRKTIHPSKQKAIQNRPLWLQQLLLPSWQRIRNIREWEKELSYLEQKSDMGSQLRLIRVQKKLQDVTNVPKFNYKLWTEHVPMTLSKTSSDPNIDENKCKKPFTQRNYYRYDSIGWIKGKGYIEALISPFAEANMEEIYKILHPLLIPIQSTKEEKGNKNLNINSQYEIKCKVLELGSGSGQHAVTFCQRNPKSILWQPSDVSQRCIQSVNNRSDFYGVQFKLNDSGQEKPSSGNCLECIHLNCNRLNTCLDTLSDDWKIIDLMVMINVLSYAPPYLQQSMWQLGKKIIKVGGGIFVYGMFLYDQDNHHNSTKTSKTIVSDFMKEIDSFNLRLQSINPEWGVRTLKELIEYANANDFILEAKFEMKYFHMGLYFRRVKSPKKNTSGYDDEHHKKL